MKRQLAKECVELFAETTPKADSPARVQEVGEEHSRLKQLKLPQIKQGTMRNWAEHLLDFLKEKLMPGEWN